MVKKEVVEFFKLQNFINTCLIFYFEVICCFDITSHLLIVSFTHSLTNLQISTVMHFPIAFKEEINRKIGTWLDQRNFCLELIQ